MSQNVLNRVYTDPNSGAAFSHWKNLLTAARKVDNTITKVDVLAFLASKPTHTLHASARNRHPKRYIKAHFPDFYIAIDLMQLSQESIKHNKPYKFVLCSSDIFSRLLYLIPIRSKSTKDVKEALELLFSRMSKPPKKILSDLESAFYSKIVQNYLKSKNIKLYSQKGAANLKTKNGIVERSQRVVRQLIAKICTEFGTKNFIKHLPYIENIYNSRKNRSTGYSPGFLHVNRTAIADYQETLLKRDLLKDTTKIKFSVGDRVRYKLVYNIFTKESKRTFSQSIHVVTEVKPTQPATFEISPPPTHQRLLYAQDLIKVEVQKNDPNFSEVPIEKVTELKQYPNGEILYSCSLIGHKEKIWLSETELKKRYILFPQSLDEIKNQSKLKNTSDIAKETKGPLTRNQKQKLISDSKQMVTRSQHHNVQKHKP